jgi:fatty acid desaturase
MRKRLSALFSLLDTPVTHVVLALFWALMTIPTLIFWSNSVAVVLIYSVYALFVGHIASFEAARNEGVDRKTFEQLKLVTEELDRIKCLLEKQADE